MINSFHKTKHDNNNDNYLVILDGSLGHLKPFLRIMGIPTIISHISLRDYELCDQDNENKKIIFITTGIEVQNILKKHQKKVYYLERTMLLSDVLKKLIPVLIKEGLTIDFSTPRCQECNQKLEIIYDVSDNPIIPENTRKHLKWAYYCPQCNKAYWVGSHWNRINKTLRNVLEELRIKLPEPWQEKPP